MDINDMIPVGDLPRSESSPNDMMLGVKAGTGKPVLFDLSSMRLLPEDQARLDALEQAQQGSAIYAKTLADLQTFQGGFVGQGGFVTDPPGSGQYRWNGATWEFLRADLLYQKLDVSVYRSTVPDPSRFSRSGYDAALVGNGFRIDESTRSGVKRFEVAVSADVINGVNQIVSERWSRCGYSYAVIGNNMRIVLPVIGAGEAVSPAPGDYIVYSAPDPGNAGKSSVFSEVRSTGKRIRLSSLGANESSPRIVGNNAIWISDRADSPPGGEYFSGLDHADEHPVRPINALACWGDSLTAQNWMQYLPESGLTIPYYRFGRSGDTSRAVASRFGAYQNLYTVSGGLIPASGTVTLTRIGVGNPTQKYGETATSVVGWLNGVYGTLAWGSNQFTFTRLQSGAATPAPSVAYFVWAPYPQGDENPTSDAGLVKNFADMINIFFFGRNNSYQTDTIVSDFEACVNSIRSLSKRYLIVPFLPQSGETPGTNGALQRAALLSALQSKFPYNFVDLLPSMKSAGNGTSQDNQDIANNIVPRSLMQSDGTHPNESGKRIEAAAIAAALTERGFIS
jgi:hypothetical protein